jgi:hypothetical protein
MSFLLRRGWSPDTPCEEYGKYQQLAEELVANLGETASPEHCEQVQKSLLFLFLELKDAKDPLHFRFPGGHPCLKECYLRYTMLVRNLSLRYKPLPPTPPPAQPPAPPRQPQRSPDDVVNDAASLADQVKQPGDTYLGEERTNTTPPKGQT